MADKTIQVEIKSYLKSLSDAYAKGDATEHTYRPAFHNFLQAVLPEANVTNEPKQIECGAPDFVLSHNNIPRGYIEAKDLDKNLDDAGFKEQFNRYQESLGNLIFTNYLEFRLVRDGELINIVSVGTIAGGKVKQTPQHFDGLADLLSAFRGYQGQTITSANNLAGHMAAKTRMLAGVIKNALEQESVSLGSSDEVGERDDELSGQLNAFKERLIHDLDPATFADIYAQTIAYGLFSARLHDTTPDTFTRHEAAELIPAANPFLRRFFQYIAGYDLDSRISWIVDDLADLFRAADVGELMKDYGKTSERNDPFLHFYETFLGEYDPKLRKSRGVYYTPEPVVNFIVRAVDDILQTRFGLPQGLADTGKTLIEIEPPASASAPAQEENQKRKQEVHKVQILDPATGTGTFLSNIVQHIYRTQFANQKGIWPEYVRSDLVPRLNGFEILMASYAMAHTKLEMVLRDTGCETGNKRLRIFLTNSLEEQQHDGGAMFAQWLSAEARAADSIKRDTPVMVVIGNPPYSGESANKGEWIAELLQPYKQEPGGGKLREKNAKWLNDDYVKFIRYGQYHIDRTGEGVLAYINNHSFLDNPTFRGMRWSLLQSFDEIYIIDLHGNSKKKEVAPDGSPDQNVFDIQQGVSINLFVKTGEKKKSEPAQVFHYDLYGRREGKYQFLWDHNLTQIGFKELEPQPPQYFFVPKDYRLQAEYDEGISLADLFPTNGTGIVTKRDKLSIHFSKDKALQAANDILKLDRDEFYRKYNLPDDVRDWKYEWAKDDVSQFGISDKLLQTINYRPFDLRKIVYTGRSRGFIGWPVFQVMQHFLKGENTGLITSRITKDTFSVLCTKHITAHKSATVYDISYIFPLYLYPDARQQNIEQQRVPNLEQDIMEAIAKGLELQFTREKQENDTSFAPVDTLDYIYAILHSPSYRERYKEFLKTDFPKVPYPTGKELFWKLVKLGGELRSLHLMEHPVLQQLVTGYNIPGSNQVEKIDFESKKPNDLVGNVHINDTQYFEGVPKTAWDFYIGGYQPAQKWLKDRKGRKLTTGELMHYQRIIVALIKTAEIMAEIDKLPIILQDGKN